MRGMSIRARLVMGMVLLVSAGLAVASTAGILLLRSYLFERVDNQVAGFGAVTPQEPPPGITNDPQQLCTNPRDPQGLRSDFVLVLLDARGDVVCSVGPDLGDSGPDLAHVPLSESSATPELATVRSQDGDTRWRVRTVALTGSDQHLVFAVSLAEADATVNRLVRLSSVISGIVLLLTAAAAWVIARIGLKPLSRIEDTAERIAAGDLTQRIPSYRSRTEVGRLARALNGMLGQIESAFTTRTESEAKLRQFISDASHELRTPVAAVRGHAELWRTGVSDDLDTVMTRIESESKRMGDLVDDMLLLARLDQSRPLEQKPVDLLSLATDAVIDAQALQPQRSITLEARPGFGAPVVTGDDARLRQVMANLLTNALVHTPPTSPIAVHIGVEDRHVAVVIRDAGPGMPPEVAAKVFDRFYRADHGRVRDHGGSGLGLAIVKSLVEAHGGTATCTSTVETGSTFVVVLPLALDSPA
jgi:two-component system, OmpR family, sensor kinase